MPTGNSHLSNGETPALVSTFLKDTINTVREKKGETNVIDAQRLFAPLPSNGHLDPLLYRTT